MTDKKAFIITAHVAGHFASIKQKLLTNICRALKTKYPHSILVVSCASEIGDHSYADLVVVDKLTQNNPHGVGEISLVQKALAILEGCNIQQVCKFGYDFILDESNIDIVDDWFNKPTKFTSCYWNGIPNAIGTWLWCGEYQFIKEIFNSIKLTDLIIEAELYKLLSSKNMLNNVFLYENNNAMLNNTWDTHGDLIIDTGSILRITQPVYNLLR